MSEPDETVMGKATNLLESLDEKLTGSIRKGLFGLKFSVQQMDYKFVAKPYLMRLNKSNRQDKPRILAIGGRFGVYAGEYALGNDLPAFGLTLHELNYGG